MSFSNWKSNSAALRLLIAVVALVAVGATLRVRALGGERRAADRAAILAALQEQETAWNRGDVEAFLEGYWRSPELSFSGSSGITRGFDGVRERYKTRYADHAAMGHLD